MRETEPGLTLIELVLGAATLVVATFAVVGAHISQLTLNEHARNLALAVQDANRVIERLRQDNAACGTSPSTVPPGGLTRWHDWLAGSMSLQPEALTAERVIVTCEDQNGTAYCGDTAAGPNPAQVGAGEWRTQSGVNTTHDPLRVTVAVCWRHRNRTIGECTWSGATLTAADGQNGPDTLPGVIESPAMLTTLVTCR